MTQAQLIAALAAALGGAKVSGKKGKSAKKAKGRVKLTEAEKTAYRAANDAECIKLFTAKGITDVQPRVNVMTYDKFLDQGRRVRKGEKSTKVGAFSLFHVSQTDPVPAVAQASNVVAMQAPVQTEAPVVH